MGTQLWNEEQEWIREVQRRSEIRMENETAILKKRE